MNARTMIVAVAARLPSASVTPSFPPQQSPMFGQRASSHTVCKPSPRRSFLILEYEAPFGIVVFKYEGNRGLCEVCQANHIIHKWECTYAFVLPRTTFSWTLSVMKSSRDGPASSVREKSVFEDDGVARLRVPKLTGLHCFQAVLFRA